jgi:hypothetical protein
LYTDHAVPPIAIPSSTILALGRLALGLSPIDTLFHCGGVPKRRDTADYCEFVSSQGTVFFRMFLLLPASKRHHLRTAPTREGILSWRRKGDRLAHRMSGGSVSATSIGAVSECLVRSFLIFWFTEV